MNAKRFKPKPLLSEPEEVALLKAIAESLNEANDVTQAMAAILPRLSQVLGLKTAWAFRFDPTRATFVEVGASGLPPALARDNASALKSSWCECQDRMVNGRLDTAVNIVRCSRLRHAEGDKQGLNFHASIPMKMNGRPLGILNVAAEGATVFTQPALDLLRAIGFHVAVTLDRASLIADMRRRNEQLEALGIIARELTGITDQQQLYQKAISSFAHRMAVDGVALYEDDQLLHAVCADARRQEEYSYRDQVSALLPESERKILSDACSALTVPIPHFPLTIRIESRNVGAFGTIDEEILTTFAWYLTALLEQTALYHQALDTARWAERRQLAADLHDSVSQHLFSAQLLVRALQQRAPRLTNAKSQEDTKRLERLASVIQTSQQEMRGLIEALRPGNTPLAVELRHRLIRLADVLGSRLSWDIADVHTTLAARAHDAVLRIVDEALQNAVKHAELGPIRVLLRRSPNSLHIQVMDLGPGFDSVQVQSGYGLNTMRDRAAAVGLGFRITSRPGHGTQVSISVPKELITHD